MSRILQLVDDGTAMLVQDAGPGPIKAEISIGSELGSDPAYWPRLRLLRKDVRQLMAFLEALGDD